MGAAEHVQTDLLCPACAGQRRFDPGAAALSCDSCGGAEAVALPEDHDAAAEFPWSPDAAGAAEAPAPLNETTHRCETCGGEVTFTGAALSDRCPYCDGAVVRVPETGETYAAMAMMPFAITEDVARAKALAWVAGRIAAPNDLKEAARSGRFAGLYAPFWTFDTREAVAYWATYSTGSGKNRRTRSTSGTMSITFDDVLVPASPHVTPLIRDGILHEFDPTRLAPYTPAYLAGFAAERHHQSVAQGLEANADDKDLLIRNHIVRKVNRRNTRVSRYTTDTSGIHYRRLLLPVWILHYRYGDATKKIVVSGLDGRTYGERPFSTWKLAGMAALASAALIAFGWAWGAMGFL